MEKRAIELFAGVGGFRVGLNSVTLNQDTVKEENNFNFVWANQWEPATKTQDAYNCYIKRFGENSCVNEDISKIDKKTIPDHDLLTGGFPCQDYSVARSLQNEKGIEGKKGVLWWQIREILEVKSPSFVLLENVDRLIKAPSKQRGRDFGIILRCFADLGYDVEYRVINAADYGMPQRRRRIYIFAYKSTTNYAKVNKFSAEEVILKEGIFAKAFPIENGNIVIKESNVSKKEYKDLLSLQENYAFAFENAGYMRKGKIYTAKTVPTFEKPTTLFDIRETDEVSKTLELKGRKLEKIIYLKGAKKIDRVANNGHKYVYSEGPVAFPDYLDKPGRTMLTSEGTVNRSTHVIEDANTNVYRILTPRECERLNMFPEDWTKGVMTDKKRYFMMGNALVCGIVSRIGEKLSEIMDNE